MANAHSQPSWRDFSIEKTLKLVGVDPAVGISEAELLARVAEYGWNRIPEAPHLSPFSIWLRQFKSPLIGILALVATVMVFVEHYSDAVVICSVLALNSLIGAYHEVRAQTTVLGLRKLTTQLATVRRDGKIVRIPSHAVVPGDILILSEGERVIADARLLETHFLRVNESLLTGESMPVVKDAAAKTKSHDPLDAPMLIYAGTSIAHGSAIAVVVATGARTRLGAISARIRESRTPIPLEQDLRRLSRLALIVITILVAAVFLLGMRTGMSYGELLYISTAIAVSAIPEALPAVLTVVLAAGMWRMAKRNALVKKLYAVEALGQVRVLALDKTGTLTLNEMMVTEMRTPTGILRISGDGYNPIGSFFVKDRMVEIKDLSEYKRVANLLPSVVQAQVLKEANGFFAVSGDPTEAAMLVLAQKMGCPKARASRNFFPFDYQKKYSVSQISETTYAIAGAPEAILAACSRVRYGDTTRELVQHEHDALAAELHVMAERGMRLVAVASKESIEPWWQPENPKGFVFEAFLGIADAIRPEAARMVARVKGAGVRTIMITGDYPTTARVVAHEVGIFEHGDHVLTGKELHTLPEEELRSLLPKISVFARVSPEDKLRIISMYQRAGMSIAMTGDGVNDAPSLVNADLGIAMARSGTDVARQAADILLLNDNLESIVAAIDEGRAMYQTIRKVLGYLFATSFGELCVIATALAIQIPVPIIAVQILWLNFVTDGFLDVALALEPKEEGTYIPKPRRTKYLLHAQDFRSMVVTGIMMTVGTIWVFMDNAHLTMDQRHTAALLTMFCFLWVSAWMSRTQYRSFFTTSLTRNKYLIGATAIVFALQVCAIYIPAFQKILHTAVIPGRVWAQTLVVALSIVVVEELRKVRRRSIKF